MISPTPADLRAARRAAGLTQAQAAKLIHSKLRTWEDWEAGVAPMHPGLWRLFGLLVAAAKASGPA